MPTTEKSTTNWNKMFPREVDAQKLESFRHPEYDEREIVRNEDLYRGNKRFFANLSDISFTSQDKEGNTSKIEAGLGYLSKGGFETLTGYKNRLKIAYYINYAGSIGNNILNSIYRKAKNIRPVPPGGRDAQTPKEISDFIDDATGKREPLYTVVKDQLSYSMATRKGHMLLDLPLRPKDKDKNGPQINVAADEKALGLYRLTARPVSVRCILDWHTGKDGKPDWVIMKFWETKRSSPWEDRTNKPYYMVYTREGWARYEIVTEKTNESIKKKAIRKSWGEHSFKEVPISTADLKEDLWLMDKLWSPALALFRGQNNQNFSLLKHAFQMPVFNMEDKENAQDPFLGPGVGLILGLQEKAQWFSPDTSASTMIQDNNDMIKTEIYRIVGQMAMAVEKTPASAQQSGESKRRDFQPMQILCEAYAEYYRQSLEHVLDMAAKAIKKPTGYTIDGLDKFDIEDLETILNDATLAKGLGIEDESPTYTRLIHTKIATENVGSMADQDTKEAIGKEIEESIQKAQEERDAQGGDWGIEPPEQDSPGKKTQAAPPEPQPAEQ